MNYQRGSIHRHKQDIEKRISELNRKLQQASINVNTNESSVQDKANKVAGKIYWSENHRIANQRESQRERESQKERERERRLAEAFKRTEDLKKSNNFSYISQKRQEEDNELFYQSSNKKYYQKSAEPHQNEHLRQVLSEILQNQNRLKEEIQSFKIHSQPQSKQEVILKQDQVQNLEEQNEVSGQMTSRKYQNVLEMKQQQEINDAFDNQCYKKKISFNIRPRQFRMSDFFNKIKNQNKLIAERMIISEQMKSQFWVMVMERILQTQKQSLNTHHSNQRYENESLTSTNELQKRVRSKTIEKIYGQCNTCLYK